MSVILEDKKEKKSNVRSYRNTASQPYDYESTLVSIVLTLLIHLLVYWIIPKNIAVSFEESGRKNEVEYVFEEFKEEPDTETMRFVETNPDVPTNVPDNTINIAARDQQAAQPDPSEIGDEATPFLNGEEELSPKILTGRLPSQSQPIVAPYQEASASQESPQSSLSSVEDGVTMVAPQPPPIPDFIDQEPEIEDGLASRLEPGEGKVPTEEDSDQKHINLNLSPINSDSVDPLQPGAQPQVASVNSQSQPQLPRPRPRLSSDVLPGPTMKSMTGVSGLGMISIEAKFSEYGDYLQRMYEAIGYQWLLLANQTRRAAAQISSRVILDFVIFKNGEIKDLQVIHSTAGQTATLICKDAVQSRTPFGKWTEEMVRTLGDEQEIRVTFIYQ